jgi:hypothetical protein
VTARCALGVAGRLCNDVGVKEAEQRGRRTVMKQVALVALGAAGLLLWGSGLGIFGSNMRVVHALEVTGWLTVAALWLTWGISRVVRHFKR